MSQPGTEKNREYRSLVEDRKACKLCASQLANPYRIDGGALDSERIGPYSQWQGNLAAPLLVVGQDFSDMKGFRQCRGWASDISTNRTLRDLVACAGLEISMPEYGAPEDRAFFTNAVLCIKTGNQKGRRQNVPMWCFHNCSSFLRRTIEVVNPTVVVTLGVKALKTVRAAFPGGDRRPLREIVGNCIPLIPGVMLAPMYHPSPQVVNRYRSFAEMCEDWEGLRPLLPPAPNNRLHRSRSARR